MTRHFSARHWLIGWLSCLALSLGVSAVRADPSVDAERAEILRKLVEYKQQLRALEDRLARLEARRAQSSRATRPKVSEVASCGIPFYLDPSGLKKLRPECEDSAKEASCEIPFVIDRGGIKRVREVCGAEVARR